MQPFNLAVARLWSSSRYDTLIWWTSIANELSNRRAGRNTHNRRSGLIRAPAAYRLAKIRMTKKKPKKAVQSLLMKQTKKNNNNSHLQRRIPAPTFPSPWLVPYSANEKKIVSTAYRRITSSTSNKPKKYHKKSRMSFQTQKKKRGKEERW